MINRLILRALHALWRPYLETNVQTSHFETYSQLENAIKLIVYDRCHAIMNSKETTTRNPDITRRFSII